MIRKISFKKNFFVPSFAENNGNFLTFYFIYIIYHGSKLYTYIVIGVASQPMQTVVPKCIEENFFSSIFPQNLLM